MPSINHLGAARPFAQVGLILLALLAVFFGLASAILPSWFVFSALLVPAIAALLVVRPEYALTAGVALVCGLIHPALVPRIPVFGGALSAADAVLVMLAFYAVWSLATRESKSASNPVAGARLLAVAMGLFGVTLAIAIPISLWFRGVDSSHVLGEVRDLGYLAVLPIAVVILRQRERQMRFAISLVVLGCLFSVGQILQGVFNLQVFSGGSLSVLETLGRQDYGTTRSVTLGIGVIALALLLTIGAHLLGVIRKPLFFTVSGLLLFGIVLTFGRTTYIFVGASILMVVSWLNLKRLPQLVGLFVVFVGIGSATVGFLKPESLAAVYYRMTSIGTEIESGYSAQGRIWEAQAMVPQILLHPLVGIGLGADYISKRGGSLTSSGLDRYAHNAYLYMAGKMGIPALAFFLASVGAIFAIGRRTAKSDEPASSRVIGAAGASMMVYYLLASVTEPHFMSDYSLVVIASVGALVYLSARRATAVGVPAPTRRAKPSYATPKLPS